MSCIIHSISAEPLPDAFSYPGLAHARFTRPLQSQHVGAAVNCTVRRPGTVSLVSGATAYGTAANSLEFLEPNATGSMASLVASREGAMGGNILRVPMPANSQLYQKRTSRGTSIGMTGITSSNQPQQPSIATSFTNASDMMLMDSAVNQFAGESSQLPISSVMQQHTANYHPHQRHQLIPTALRLDPANSAQSTTPPSQFSSLPESLQSQLQAMNHQHHHQHPQNSRYFFIRPGQLGRSPSSAMVMRSKPAPHDRIVSQVTTPGVEEVGERSNDNSQY